MDYEELRAAIQMYSLDFEPSFASNIDLFIHLAEARLRFNVRMPNFRKDLPGALTAGTQAWTVPTDFLAPDSFTVIGSDNSLNTLLNKDSEFIDVCYPAKGTLGPPRFYCFLNETTIKLGPTPDQPYATILGYFYQPVSITDSPTGTSWLGDHFEHALVSGSLAEAAKYMKSEDNLYQRFDAAFKEDLSMDLNYAKGRAKKDTYQEPDQRVLV